jgi:hypothetical protein
MQLLLHAWPEVPELARRCFRFSPPIAGVAPNEWTLHGVSSDEAVVRNAASGQELSIPRRWIGDVTRLEEPVRVVALLKRLEFAQGRVRPVDRAVIEMPVAQEAPRVRAAHPGEVVTIRETPQPPARWKHYLRISVALGCLACFIAVFVFRQGRGGRVRRLSARPARLVPHPPALTPPVLLEKR